MAPVTRRRRLTPPQVIAFGFLGMILLGSAVLALGVASQGPPVPYLDALFTAASAVCVTGLVTVDTGTTYSHFGQWFVLFLIQMGGLGYMTSTTLVIFLAGRSVSLRGRLLLQEAHGQPSIQGMIHLTRYILVFTLGVELVGSLLLVARFSSIGLPHGRAMAFGFFHGVSAFCNAGFDLMGPLYGRFTSFVPFARDVPINLVVTTLIILGGLGFPVALDLTSGPRHRLSLHTKVVLIITPILLVGGTLIFALAEWANPSTIGGMPWPQKLLASYFQSVTARTAGFQTVHIGHLQVQTLFVLGILMFIGTSPAGTGGGIKSTTAALIVGAAVAAAHNRREPEILGRRIPAEVVYRALSVAVLAFVWVNVVLLILSFTETGALQRAGLTRNGFICLLFEVLSAFGTVGLSTGLTPYLTPLGKLLIILTMYVGRVGPVTAVLLLMRSARRPEVTLPEGRILIG